jgi:hypothetical protein
MMKDWFSLPLLLLAVALWPANSLLAQTTIVVNFGPHPSAEVAARSEAKVNWLDADTGDDTVCTECFAAVELQSFLRQMTGRTDDFAIVDDQAVPAGELILVGGPASNAAARNAAAELGVGAAELTSLGSQGYRIKTATVGGKKGDSPHLCKAPSGPFRQMGTVPFFPGRRVTLVAGGSRVGTLYGVYDLLHRMGCRWFGPESFHEEIPRAEWRPAFDVSQKPAFAIRGFHVYQNRGGPDIWLWMARNRLNYWCIESDDVPLLQKLGMRLACGGHTAEPRFLGPELPYPYRHSKFPGHGVLPADPYPVSGQYQGDVNRDGKLSYFEAHSEWFGMKDGRRVPDIPRDGSGGVNFCTSNADAVEEFSKNYVQALIDGACKGADVVNFWTLDNAAWCQCERCCAEGTPTDRDLRLVCAFDRQLKKAQRDKRLNRPVEVRFLAYADLSDPPTRPLPADFDYQTCVATFYPISRCLAHEFDDPKCPRNAEKQKLLRGWLLDPGRHYRGQVEIGEYYNVSRYKSLPLCLMHVMAHDIPYYHRAGARFFQYMHVTTGRWGNKSLTDYQLARQTWDVGTDCESLWSDFFARRYGSAADVMRQFYESLEKMYGNVEALKGWSPNLASRLQSGAPKLFIEPHLRYSREPGIECDAPTLIEMVEHGRVCRRLIDRAMAMPLDERIKTRIAEDERMFTYGERTLAYYAACAQAFQLGRAGKLDEARKHLAEAKRLAELLRKDTWSVDLSFIHDEPFPLDAFHSTYATGALDHLTKLLGPTDPAKNPD